MAAGRLVAACDDPGAVADRLRAGGARTIRVLGQDAPYALLRACGLAPVRMVPDQRPTPDADALAGDGTLSHRGRSLLQQIVADASGDPLLITHADNELPQIFATVRELLRTGDIAPRPVHMLDLLHLPRASSRAHNRGRIDALIGWLATIDAPFDPAALAEAAAEERARVVPLAGAARLAAIGAAHALLPAEWAGAVAEAVPAAGEPVFVLGSPHFSCARYAALEARGLIVAGDMQDWGDPLLQRWAESPATLDALADPSYLAPLMMQPASARADAAIARMRAADIRQAVLFVAPRDEAAAWDAGYFERRLRAEGISVERDERAPPGIQASSPAAKRAPEGRRSRKSLASIVTFGSFQKTWFGALRDQVAAGAPLALVNANSPQEILRAMEIPFVVNQWWASIAAAKQQSSRYFELLRAHGYPSDAEAYSAQALAAAFDTDAEQAPWGGLPRPSFVHAVASTDATPRIFDHMARETGADPFLFERSIETRLDLPIDWWDGLADRWDELLEPHRIDLMVAELEALIARIEAISDRRFDADRFAAIMDLVNEQEDYYRKTRDLIAAAHPAPVSIADTMPATMVPQWHRGTVWARDAARAFHDEVKARAEAGEAACPGECLRLMWVGRGMWSDMGFYQRWQESHGAVFVWSMYLSLAADGYIRRTDGGRDPMRALAARFVTMGDELRMPTWAGAWHVREAETHGVHGVVALSDADPFVLRALRRTGLPVLALEVDNYNREREDEAAIDRRIAAFLEGPVADYAALKSKTVRPE